MSNFILKNNWSERDWDIFYANINILLSENRLKKNEFNQIVGVKNFFRKDRRRVSPKVIETLCKKFNIEKEWLATPHTLNDIKIEYQRRVDTEKDQNVFNGEMSRAFVSLAKIYESGDDQLISAAFTTVNAIADKVEKNDGKGDK